MELPATPQKKESSPRKQLPLKLRQGRKSDVRTQFAALCYRTDPDGKLRICLVTSRRSRRWILPKGWPMHKQTPADAAATEAWEEAGLVGTPFDHCLGVYAYVKTLSKSLAPVVVMVYPLAVTQTHDDWPEKSQRKRKWLTPKKAAKRLAEPELRQIVTRFDPEKLR